MGRWYPTATHASRQRPDVGVLIAWRHAVWQVTAVVDVELSDADRAEWLDAGMPDLASWSRRPYRVDVDWVGGARPDWAPPDGPVEDGGSIDVTTQHTVTWRTYPSGRWPQCSCCGEPVPCRAELEDDEVTAALNRVAEFAARLPGCCWGCGDPISSRQKVAAYPGDNLDLPGGPDVLFHTRAKCWSSATRYERRWLDADPRRERILTWPDCDGVLIVHWDGSSECTSAMTLFRYHESQADCRGHLSHDHGCVSACYVGGDWFARPEDFPGCPRGCPREGHPGAHPAPRPPRNLAGQR